MYRNIPHDHICFRIPVGTQVLCQPFVGPYRDTNLGTARNHILHAAAVNHIIDHGMNQFMMDHMAELLIVPFKRKYYTILEQFCNSANAFPHVGPDHISLLEIVM